MPPRACQDNNVFLFPRCPGSVAKYRATFQWCRRQISDHDLDPVCEVKARTGSFQMWKILGSAQSIPRGGPTTDRRSRRYATSILCKSLRYVVRCPASNQSIGDMTRSRYSVFCNRSFRVTKDPPVCIESFCRRLQATLTIACCGLYRRRRQHASLPLMGDSLSRTDVINPFAIVTVVGPVL